MFLICNGILAFLAKTSVMSSCCSLSDSELGAQITTNLTQTKASVTDAVDGDYNNVPLVDEEEEAEDTYNNEVGEENESVGREEEIEREVSVVAEDDHEEYKERESGCLVKQEEQGEGLGAPPAANEEVASAEELNRKFEEFISKMKEEIRVEAQKQLIGV